MEATHWEFDATQVEFVTHRNVPAVKSKTRGGYQVQLKDHIFTNGTIEFDVELVGMGFPGIATNKINAENRSFVISWFLNLSL